MKVGMVGEGWAILGTRISDHMVSEVIKRGKVNIWTDPDSAGRNAAQKFQKQLTAFGVSVRVIHSTKDPKLHSLQYISDLLSATAAAPCAGAIIIP
jgi:DNA primase